MYLSNIARSLFLASGRNCTKGKYAKCHIDYVMSLHDANLANLLQGGLGLTGNSFCIGFSVKQPSLFSQVDENISFNCERWLIP